MNFIKQRLAGAPKVIVIGGGATGMGIARDAALRGFRVTVVERGDIGSGTTGHFHGILHSGGRYAVNDPTVAAECYSENQILRRVAPAAISDTGGMFVALTDDEASHADSLVQACRIAGIPVTPISVAAALEAEPFLTPAVTRAFRVPDGYIDGPTLLALNKQAASQGQTPARFISGHVVTGFTTVAGNISAVTIRDTQNGSQQQLDCDYVINAAGVWSGKTASLAGLSLNMVYDKGTMIVFKKQYSSAVLNRCRPEDDGDLLVPGATGSIMGTTARTITNPDNCLPTQEAN